MQSINISGGQNLVGFLIDVLDQHLFEWHTFELPAIVIADRVVNRKAIFVGSTVQSIGDRRATLIAEAADGMANDRIG